jgi:hypothetical protein
VDRHAADASICTEFPDIGAHVLVQQASGVSPLKAEILAHNFHRPHLVKVGYGHPGADEWIARSRIAGPALGV